jgi:hypothetical protein
MKILALDFWQDRSGSGLRYRHPVHVLRRPGPGLEGHRGGHVGDHLLRHRHRQREWTAR